MTRNMKRDLEIYTGTTREKKVEMVEKKDYSRKWGEKEGKLWQPVRRI